jgi:FkbM family methyltransferase
MSILDGISNTAHQFQAARRSPHGFRGGVFGDYLRIQAKEILARRGWIERPRVERIAGAEMRCPNYGALLGLVKEIWLAGEYYFRSGDKAPTVIDAGANIGVALLYFHQLCPGAQLIAFEPDPTAFAALEENAKRNRIRARVYNAAVGESAGQIEFFSDPDSPGGVSMSAYAGGRLTAMTTVECVRLSDYIDGPVTLLKLDVEGAETGVLRELREHSKLDLIRELLVEFHPHKGAPGNQLAACLEILAGYSVTQKDAEGALMLHAVRQRDA